jgi:hypothetical protein
MLELKNLTVVNGEWFKPCVLGQKETAERLDNAADVEDSRGAAGRNHARRYGGACNRERR